MKVYVSPLILCGRCGQPMKFDLWKPGRKPIGRCANYYNCSRYGRPLIIDMPTLSARFAFGHASQEKP